MTAGTHQPCGLTRKGSCRAGRHEAPCGRRHHWLCYSTGLNPASFSPKFQMNGGSIPKARA
jgi:hypothetical protein